MQILTNLWVALSTPNEMMMSIIFIPLNIIEMSLAVFLFTSILNIDTSRKKEITYIILSSIISLFSNYFMTSPYNYFINYISLFIIIKFVFKYSKLKTLLAVIIPIITSGLLITLLSNPFLKLLHLSFDQLQTIPICKIAFSTFIYALIGIIILIIKTKNSKTFLLNNLSEKSKRLFICNIIFGIIIIIAQAFLVTFYLDILPITYTCISFFSLLAYFSLSIFSLTKVIKLENTTKELENSEEYNRTLQIMHDNVRCFKHDFDNIVTTIGGYINTDDMKGLKKYYYELEIDCKRVNNLYILNPKIVNNPGVYSLLTNKYQRAEEQNINITIEFLLDLNALNMEIYHFTRVLGILLDNAIEAAAESKEKIVNVIFRNEDRNNRQMIIIENSYKNKDVDVEEIFEKGKTEKENHTGLGLFEVRKIISKSTNINLHTTKDDLIFKQQLEIYNL